MKLRRMLATSVKEAAAVLRGDNDADSVVLEVSCWHHLRNVWFGGMTKKLSVGGISV